MCLESRFQEKFHQRFEASQRDAIRHLLGETIELVERAQHTQEIKNIKKLKAGESHYRIRIGDYRIGLILEDDTFIFVRFLHRKDLYKYFP